MDISIAGTIYQSQSLWITGAIGIIGAAVGGGATYLIERQKIKDNEKQRMQQIYGELMGRKYMLLQSYASYYNALINTNHANLRSIINAISTVDYDSIKKLSHDAGYKEFNRIINEARENSIEFKGAQKVQERSWNLMIQLGESNERIWESIGLVQSTFSDTNELVDLVDHIQKNNKIVGEDIENEGTIALVSDGGRAHFIIGFIYYELYVPCETHHDCNSHEFLKPSVC